MATRSQDSNKLTAASLDCEQHDPWLRLTIQSRLSGFDAEDLAQDAWLRLLTRRSSVEVRHVRSFLLKIVANLAVDTKRQERSRVDAEAGVAAGWGTSANAEQADAVLAKQVILSLPPALKDVFLLSRFGGLTNVQIAERLGISPKTVEWRMTRALAHCAAQLRR